MSSPTSPSPAPEGLASVPGQAPQPQETEYLALRKLLIPSGPGRVPGSLRVAPGQRFILDGDEPIEVAALVRQGAIKLYQATPDERAFIKGEEAKRTTAAARRRLRRSNAPTRE